MLNLKIIWNELKSGTNLEIYTNVVLALLLAVLTLIDVAPAKWINPIILAVLALLMISMLGNRHRIDRIYQKLTLTVDSILLREWHKRDFEDDLRKSNNLLIIGTVLARTIKDYKALFADKLKRGGSMRVLVTDPLTNACEIAAHRGLEDDVDVGHTRHLIEHTLKRLSNLRESSKNLEIRVTAYPLTLGGVFMDTEATRGVIYLEYYTYKMSDGDLPKLKLRRRDGYWYDFFVKQAQVLWEGSKKWEPNKQITH